MRAAVFHGPHDVRVEDRERPPAPGPGEIVVEVLRASICGTDAAEYDHGPVLVALHRAHPHSGHAGPLVLGHEFVGRVVARGPGVDAPALGARVVTGAGVSCGSCRWCREGRTNLCASYYTVGLHVDGGLAEQVAVPASTCVPVLPGCTDDAAALGQPMAVAIHALDRGMVTPDIALVVNGCGGIGAFAIAAAAHRGVRRIVGVDIDPARLAAARRLGASHVVDAGVEDVRAVVAQLTDGAGADVSLEVSGAPSGPRTCVAATRTGGTVVLVGLQRDVVGVDLLDVALREIDLRGSLAHVCATDLPAALEVLAAGEVTEVMVDRVVALSRVVADGLEPLVAREVAGKVLVDPRA